MTVKFTTPALLLAVFFRPSLPAWIYTSFLLLPILVAAEYVDYVSKVTRALLAVVSLLTVAGYAAVVLSMEMDVHDVRPWWMKYLEDYPENGEQRVGTLWRHWMTTMPEILVLAGIGCDFYIPNWFCKEVKNRKKLSMETSIASPIYIVRTVALLLILLAFPSPMSLPHWITCVGWIRRYAALSLAVDGYHDCGGKSRNIIKFWEQSASSWYCYFHIMALQVLSALPHLAKELPTATWALGITRQNFVGSAQAQILLLMLFVMLGHTVSAHEYRSRPITRSNSIETPPLFMGIHSSRMTLKRLVSDLLISSAGFFLALTSPSIIGAILATVSLSLAYRIATSTGELASPRSHTYKSMEHRKELSGSKESKYGALLRQDHDVSVVSRTSATDSTRLTIVVLSITLLAAHSISAALTMRINSPDLIIKYLSYILGIISGSMPFAVSYLSAAQITLVILIARPPTLPIEVRESSRKIFARAAHFGATFLTLYWSSSYPGTLGPFFVMVFVVARLVSIEEKGGGIWMLAAATCFTILLFTQYLWVVVVSVVGVTHQSASWVAGCLGVDILLRTHEPNHTFDTEISYLAASMELGTCVSLCLCCILQSYHGKCKASDIEQTLLGEREHAFVFNSHLEKVLQNFKCHLLPLSGMWYEAIGWFVIVCIHLSHSPGPIQSVGCQLLLYYPAILFRHKQDSEERIDSFGIAWGCVAASVWGFRIAIRHVLGNEVYFHTSIAALALGRNGRLWEDLKDVALLFLLVRMIRKLASRPMTGRTGKCPPPVPPPSVMERKISGHMVSTDSSAGHRNLPQQQRHKQQGNEDLVNGAKAGDEVKKQKEAAGVGLSRDPSYASVTAAVGSASMKSRQAIESPRRLVLGASEGDPLLFGGTSLSDETVLFLDIPTSFEDPTKSSKIGVSAEWYSQIIQVVYGLVHLCLIVSLAIASCELDASVLCGGYVLLLVVSLITEVEYETALITLFFGATDIAMTHALSMFPGVPQWLIPTRKELISSPVMAVFIVSIAKLQVFRWRAREQDPRFTKVPHLSPLATWWFERARTGDLIEVACLGLMTTVFARDVTIFLFFDLAAACMPLYLPTVWIRKIWPWCTAYFVTCTFLNWVLHICNYAMMGRIPGWVMLIIRVQAPGFPEILGVMIVCMQHYAFLFYDQRVPWRRAATSSKRRSGPKEQMQEAQDFELPSRRASRSNEGATSRDEGRPQLSRRPSIRVPHANSNLYEDGTIQGRLLVLKAFLVLTALFAFAIGALRLGGGTGFEDEAMMQSKAPEKEGTGGILAGLYVVACVSLMGQLQGLFSKKRQWKWRLIGLLNGCSLLVSLAFRFSSLELLFDSIPWLGARACYESVALDILLFGLLGLRRRLFERGFGFQLGRYWQLMKIQSLAREHANRERRKWLERVTQLEVTIAYFKRQLRYYERWKQRSAPNLSKGVSLVLDECGIDLDLKHATMDSIAGVVRSLEARRAFLETDPAAAPVNGESTGVGLVENRAAEELRYKLTRNRSAPILKGLEEHEQPRKRLNTIELTVSAILTPSRRPAANNSSSKKTNSLSSSSSSKRSRCSRRIQFENGDRAPALSNGRGDSKLKEAARQLWGKGDETGPTQRIMESLRRTRLEVLQGGKVIVKTQTGAVARGERLVWENVSVELETISPLDPILINFVLDKKSSRLQEGTSKVVGWCTVGVAELQNGTTTSQGNLEGYSSASDTCGLLVQLQSVKKKKKKPLDSLENGAQASNNGGTHRLDLKKWNSSGRNELTDRKVSRKSTDYKRTATQTVQERIWQGVYYKDSSHIGVDESLQRNSNLSNGAVPKSPSALRPTRPRSFSARSPDDLLKARVKLESEQWWGDTILSEVRVWVSWIMETFIASLWFYSDFHDLAQKPGTRTQRLGRALGAWVLSNTDVLCYTTFIADHVASYNPMSVVFPLSMFLVAIPSPMSKTYWKAMASYCSAIIVFKTFLRLPFVADNIVGDGIISVVYYPREFPYGHAHHSQEDDIRPMLEWDLAFDVLVLLALSAHRQVLMLKGVWDSQEQKKGRRLTGIGGGSFARRPERRTSRRRDSSLTLSPEPPDVTPFIHFRENSPLEKGEGEPAETASAPMSPTSGVGVEPVVLEPGDAYESPSLGRRIRWSSDMNQKMTGDHGQEITGNVNPESNEPGEGQRRERRRRTEISSVAWYDEEDEAGFEEEEEEEEEIDRKRNISSLIDHFRKHYFRVQRKRPLTSRDLYGWIFWTEVVAFILIVTFFPRFSGNYGDSLQETFASNRVPLAFFFAMFTQFLLIVIDRVLYLTNSRKWKGRLQMLGVLTIHSIVFLLPLANSPPLGSNPGLLNNPVTYQVYTVFYIVKAIYLFASAHQVRSGYPPFAKEDGTFTQPSLTGLVLFSIYRAIPFLFEAKTILDWTCSSSPLFFGDWLKLHDIHCNLYMVECDLVYRKSLKRKKGDIYRTEIKVVVGFFAIFGLVLIVWLPFMIYLTGVPLFVNPLQSVTLTTKIEGAHNSWRLCEHSDVVGIHDVPAGPRLDALRAPPYNLPNNLMQETVQQVAVSGDSTYAWTITPPSLRKLIETVQNDETCRLVMAFRFEMESGSVSRVRYETALNRQQMLKTLNATHTTPDSESTEKSRDIAVTVEGAYPLYTHILAAGEARPVGPKVNLKLSRMSSQGVEWWAMQSVSVQKEMFDPNGMDSSDTEVERKRRSHRKSQSKTKKGKEQLNEDPEHVFSRVGVVFFTLSDQMLLGKLIDSSIYEYGMFALYFTFVFSLGRFLRVYVVGMSYRIIYEDWGDVEFVKELLNDIYAARWDREYELEEEMYGELIQLYRHPEKLINVTRPPTKLEGIINWPSTAPIKKKID